MTFALTWLSSVLTAAGLTVIETPGWQLRGHGDVGPTKGVLCHDTAGALNDQDLGDLSILINGRPDLPGPLCNLALGRSGKFYTIAAGKAYHAGAGVWKGVTEGNSELVGIEAENTGLPNDPWPEVQMDAYAKGCAAIMKQIGGHSDMVAGHKEYALPPGRKSDPDFDMDAFRLRVHNYLMGV